jgi:RNA polymerase Rpb2, domain 6/RNA polymerase Rpb2, domain 4/N-terminal domain of galactosyltransferase/RNA polymerase beta subunit/N-terminal region of glycosyl transferase group 7/RNA polymerase Rpb2, domain 2
MIESYDAFIETLKPEAKLYASRLMPQQCREKNVTYDFEHVLDGKVTRIPVMVQSKMCVLNNMPPDVLSLSGERKGDKGGYFILNGKEVAIVNELKDVPYLVQRQDEGNFRVPISTHLIPLFIVMRAYGFISDKSIVDACFLNADEVHHLIPCVYDAGKVFTQRVAIDYIADVTKIDPMECLKTLLPGTFHEKAFTLGTQVRNLIRGISPPKRVCTAGMQLSEWLKNGGDLVTEPMPDTFLARESLLRKIKGVERCEYGFFDPIEPEQLAVSARVTVDVPIDVVLLELRKSNALLERPKDMGYETLKLWSRVCVNHRWLFSTDSPGQVIHHLKQKRREGSLSSEVSVSFDFDQNTVNVFTDAGRLQRPLSYGDGVEMVDRDEQTNCMVAFSMKEYTPKTTHGEVAGSDALGFITNMVALPNHNTFDQNKKACESLRMAKEGGDAPLFQSVHHVGERGYNVLVGVAAYGYNSSECVVVSQAAVDRGLPFTMGSTIGSRNGLVGVVSLLPENQMPFSTTGRRLDVLVNPNADVPIGFLWETLIGKAHLCIGEAADGTAFETKPGLYLEVLELSGMHGTGNEVWYHGDTGKQMQCNVFSGCAYVMPLKEAKETSQSRGQNWRLSRQSVEGAEIESEAILAHGMGAVLKDAFLTRSDGVQLQVKTDGMWGKGTQVTVPNAFKILTQELTTMNVQLRMVVADDRKMNKRKRGVVKTGFREMSHVTPSYLDNRLFEFSQKVTKGVEVKRLLHAIVLETTWKSVVETVPQLQDVVFSKFSKSTIERSLTFTFERKRTGILVRVKNNRASFVWLDNAEFKNDFSAKLLFEGEPDPETFLQKVEKTLAEAAGERTRDTTKWHANAAELIAGEARPEGVAEFYDLVQNTCSRRRVCDCVFMMNVEAPQLGKEWREANAVIYGAELLPTEYRNKTYLPVLSQYTTEKHLDVPVPTCETWRLITGEKFKGRETKRSNVRPWAEREAKFVWRGEQSDVGDHLVKLAATLEGLDAEFVAETAKMMATAGKDVINVSFQKSVGAGKDVESKFAVVTGEIGRYVQRGCCVLMVESTKQWWTEWKGWRVGDPWREDAEVLLLREDLADDTETRSGGLVKTMEWCLKNDALCEAMAANAMKKFEARYNRSAAYDYMANIMNSISAKQESLTKYDEKELEEKDAELKKMWKPLRPKLQFKMVQQKESDLTTSVVIIPFRDGKDQNRTEQLNAWVQRSQHKGLNVLIVEQSQDGQKFNRGALLNAGFLFLKELCPGMQTFVMHDVDVVFPEEFVNAYYGTDERAIMHVGSAVAGKGTELGRVLKFSKKAFEEVNGYPNTFYGWGGEDEAMAYRLNGKVLTRPVEKNVGEEVKTTNDIKEGHLTGNKELFRYENLLLETICRSGLDNLQFALTKHVEVEKNVRRITVKLTPFEREEVSVKAEEKGVEEKKEEVKAEEKGVEEKKEEVSVKVEEKGVEEKKEEHAETEKETKKKIVMEGEVPVEVEDVSDANELKGESSNDESETEKEEKIVILGNEPPVLMDVPTLTNTDSLSKEDTTTKVIKYSV